MNASVKIATPISSIFKKPKEAAEIVDMSGALETRDIAQKVKSELPRLYHSDFEIAQVWGGRDVAYLSSLIKKNKVELVSFHLGSCYSEPIVADGMYRPGGQKLSPDKIITNAAVNVKKLKNKIGSTTKIAIENNNYFPTGAYEIVTEPTFINRLLRILNIYLLLDISHAKITAKNKRLSVFEYIEDLNLSRVRQIHISRPVEREGLWRDAHEELQPDDWKYFKKVLALCPRIKYATIEYYKDVKKLKLMTKELKDILDG